MKKDKYCHREKSMKPKARKALFFLFTVKSLLRKSQRALEVSPGRSEPSGLCGLRKQATQAK